MLSRFKTWLAAFEKTLVGRIVVAFVSSFVAVLIPGLLSLLSNAANTHDWSAAKAAVVALISAAFVSAFAAARAVFTGSVTSLK
jgi:hypothetical protein